MSPTPSEPPASVPLRREVASSMVLEVVDPTAFVLAVSVARGVPTAVESLRVRIDGADLEPRELPDVHGGRLHLFETVPGLLSVEYAATITGRGPTAAVDRLDEIVYLRPSRYVQSDSLTSFARSTFPGLGGLELVRSVEAWVHDRLDYVPEASSPTGGAVETLDAGAGVCRDYAHLTAALLRALDTPARLVSVYAPGIQPPDFHAVVEALVGGRWIVVDATRLAPRSTMVRIATGRDATDTAFETNTLADVRLASLSVRASSIPVAGPEDPGDVVELS